MDIPYCIRKLSEHCQLGMMFICPSIISIPCCGMSGMCDVYLVYLGLHVCTKWHLQMYPEGLRKQPLFAFQTNPFTLLCQERL